jgi:hypothetical protein
MEGGLPESAMAVVSVSAVENRACCLLTDVWRDERGVGVNPDAEERSNIEVVSERRIVLEVICFSLDIAVVDCLLACYVGKGLLGLLCVRCCGELESWRTLN